MSPLRFEVKGRSLTTETGETNFNASGALKFKCRGVSFGEAVKRARETSWGLSASNTTRTVGLSAPNRRWKYNYRACVLYTAMETMSTRREPQGVPIRPGICNFEIEACTVRYSQTLLNSSAASRVTKNRRSFRNRLSCRRLMCAWFGLPGAKRRTRVFERQTLSNPVGR
jgi:hypothetical protein